MTDTETDERSDEELGPIDYLVVEFPAAQSGLTGDAAADLAALAASSTIRVPSTPRKRSG